MEHQNKRLTPEDCIAFALECEGDSLREQDPAHRDRLRRMASVLRELAADLGALAGRS
jgi:hypothetical protein